MNISFDPTKDDFETNTADENFVNYRGEVLQPPFQFHNAEKVSENCDFDLEHLPFRNPQFFKAGNLHKNFDMWKSIGANEEVLDWLTNGVNVEKFFRHFQGNFKGRSFDSDKPPSMFFQNSPICQDHIEFIQNTLLDRVRNGSMSVWGRVGLIDPPHLVMPLTIEETKPRLCHDERFLNLWIVDKPFLLDTLKEVPRLVEKDSFMTSVDDKSGYDHIFLSESSRKYFGVQFGGWYFVYNTIPFGFKASAYIYHSTGLVATGYCRKLGVPCLQYIDDRLILQFFQAQTHYESSIARAYRSLYIVCEVLVRLGYFIGLGKSVFEPRQVLIFLGMLIDSIRQAFALPYKKKKSFAELRTTILVKKSISLKCLQRFTGKCISFMLAVPAAKLYTREANLAIGRAIKNSRMIQVKGKLREEIAHWEFLDSWEGFVPWRSEKHLQVVLATDASAFRWAAIVNQENKLGDFFDQNDTRPIHLKEADALYKTLLSLVDKFANHRVDALVDNQAVVASWEREGGRCSELNDIMKSIFVLCQKKNIDLHLQYIPTDMNPADSGSRLLSLQDCRLSVKSWEILQEKFGPHSIDLMALDSNVMRDIKGNPLKHFTPYPCPSLSPVNVFAQDFASDDNPYVYPPFCLVSPVLQLLFDQKPKMCTFVFPEFTVLPSWWPKMWSFVEDFVVLGKIGDIGVIESPSKNGYQPYKLSFNLFAARLNF